MSGASKARLLRQAEHKQVLCLRPFPNPLSLSLSKAPHGVWCEA